MKKLLLSLVLLIASSSQAGYLSVAESGEVINNDYAFSLIPQLITSEGGGFNIDAAVDMPWDDSTSFRGQAGGGKTDFHLGASVKFIPFPDIGNQPAIGVKSAVWYAHDENENFLSLMVAPLFSRRIGSDYGLLVPYLAVPITFTSLKNKNTTGLQLTVGSELRNTEWKNVVLVSELAFNLQDSFSALTLGISFPFDPEKGLRR